MLKRQNTTLNISANIPCFQNTALFSCQECDGRWTTLNNPLTDWGLQVTKERSNSVENYVLKVKKKLNLVRRLAEKELTSFPYLKKPDDARISHSLQLM